MNLPDLVLLSLATWRLASLLTSELGPFDILEKVRYWLGVRYDTYGNRYAINWLAKGVLCLWCNSMWFSAMLTVAHHNLLSNTNLCQWVLNVLAVSAGAIIVESVINK